MDRAKTKTQDHGQHMSIPLSRSSTRNTSNNNEMKFTPDGNTLQFLFLAKMIKDCRILTAACKLDDPKIMMTDPELAREFC